MATSRRGGRGGTFSRIVATQTALFTRTATGKHCLISLIGFGNEAELYRKSASNAWGRVDGTLFLRQRGTLIRVHLNRCDLGNSACTESVPGDTGHQGYRNMNASDWEPFRAVLHSLRTSARCTLYTEREFSVDHG